MYAHDKSLGSFRVGTVVTTWPQSRVPKPKNRHHIHCSKVRPFVENAIFPYWMITTWKTRFHLVNHSSESVSHPHSEAKTPHLIRPAPALTCDIHVPIQIV